MNKLKNIIREYLKNRPSFYAYLRPQEAILFFERIKSMKKPILDFGCGDGFFAHTIFNKKFIDVGLDLSTSRIHEAPKTGMYKRLDTYDGSVIPFKSDMFRTIISNCVFEHVPHIGESLVEMHRVMKKNGLLITTVMCSSWSDNLLGGKFFGRVYKDWFNAIQHHDSLLSKNQWSTLFKKSGFEVVEAVDYLYEKASQKTEIYHYLSIVSLITYTLFAKWNIISHVSAAQIRKIEKMMKEDKKNPSACFFVLKKI